MAQHDPAVAGILSALLQCLEDEYTALLSEDASRLETVLARKEQLLAQLAADPGMALGQAQGKPRSALTLADALARARDLNRRNAVVLRPRAAANQARLRCLQSALGGVALYEADGQAAAMPRPIGAGRSAA
jgi:flagellar biosynthesis/type III secretory pathway chaperone